jgi:hypothetical protein
MRWSEIIRLKLAGSQYEFPIPKIKVMIQGLNSKAHGLLEFRVFRHALTLAGLNICQDLRKYGVVAHFVWIEDI